MNATDDSCPSFCVTVSGGSTCKARRSWRAHKETFDEQSISRACVVCLSQKWTNMKLDHCMYCVSSWRLLWLLWRRGRHACFMHHQFPALIMAAGQPIQSLQLNMRTNKSSIMNAPCGPSSSPALRSKRTCLAGAH